MINPKASEKSLKLELEKIENILNYEACNKQDRAWLENYKRQIIEALQNIPQTKKQLKEQR